MAIKSLITALIFISSSSLVFADQLPCWCNFVIESKNQKYKAIVDMFSEDSLKEPWEARWTLTVYDNSNTEKPIWTTFYEYSGYEGGDLSDDGKYFVYLEFWYYKDYPLLKIYNNGTAINTNSLKGSNFKISPKKLVNTVSHTLWLSDTNENGFIITSDKQISYMVTTIDKKKHFINLDKGTYFKSK